MGRGARVEPDAREPRRVFPGRFAGGVDRLDVISRRAEVVGISRYCRSVEEPTVLRGVRDGVEMLV